MEVASGMEIPVNDLGRREGDVGICVADPTKTMTELGWMPSKSLVDSCNDLCKLVGVKDGKFVGEED